MKIGIDARFWGPSGKGLGRYSEELIKELEQIDYVNQYLIFLGRHNFDQYIPKNPNFHKVLADIPWYSWEEQIKFPRLLESYQLDLVHFLHFNVPIRYRRPFVVTIHDLILIEYPTRKASKHNWWMYWVKNFGYRVVISNAVRRANQVIVISEYTRQSVIKRFKIKPEKTHLTYEGVDLAKFNPLNKQAFPYDQWGISPQKFLLYVGNAYPHKNIDGLVRAFKELITKSEFAQELKLVLVGKVDYFFEKIIELVKHLELEDRVIFPGFVPDEELADLFENCSLYVFPSFYEGFGLPPLEAMAMGAPIALSNRTCLPEIFGEAAEYFDPANQTEMIEAIKRMITDSRLVASKQKHVPDILARYSWEDMAKNTLAVYNKTKDK